MWVMLSPVGKGEEGGVPPPQANERLVQVTRRVGYASCRGMGMYVHMGRRANPTMIGAFIVGAVALIVIGLLVFGRGHFFPEARKFVLYFDGSIKGLNVGAPVDFQGVKVGSVKFVQVYRSKRGARFRTPVYIELDPRENREHQDSGGTNRAQEILSSR